MKRGCRIGSLLLCLCLIFCLSGCGKLPESGPLGTVETAARAAEQDDILYFLYNVGPVYAPVSVAAYDMETGEFSEKIAIPDTDIYGFQLDGDDAYCLTEDAVYRCALDGTEQEVLAQTDQEGAFCNSWMFLLKNKLYLCRSSLSLSDELVTQIVSVSTKNGEMEVLSEMADSRFYFPSTISYRDGTLYAWTASRDTIYTLDLKSGETGEMDQTVQDLFAMEDGLYLREQGDFFSLQGDGFSPETEGFGAADDSQREGSFIGCDGENACYLGSNYSLYGSIYRIGPEGMEDLTPDYAYDMTTDVKAYVAGDHVLFYSTEDLTDGGKQDGMVHYLYLVDGEELVKIAAYTQDYTYS